jgi:hypothetical protein
MASARPSFTALAGPVFAGEQIALLTLQSRAAAAFHKRDEGVMNLALDRFQPRNVIRVFRQERIELRLVLAEV